MSCGSGYGISGASAQPYTVPSPAPPGPGCTATNYNNTACTAASVNVGFIGAGGVHSDQKQQAEAKCAPNFNQKQVNTNTVVDSTTIDQGVTLMSKNSLKSIAEATNQMIVNSITNTTNNTKQEGNVRQDLTIKVDGCAGTVNIKNVSNDATIDMSQVSTLTMKAIDDVRTDLATSILGEFKANISEQNQQTIKADLTTVMAAQNMSSLTQDIKSAIADTQKTQLPVAANPPIKAENLSANTNIEQINTQSSSAAVSITAPYTSSIEFDKTLQTIINNSVTQNFTKDTLNILVQTLNIDQNLLIDVANVGGDCNLENISQNANVVLRQTMSSKMDLGTAIINKIQNDLGISTDDTVAVSNLQKTTTTTTNDLRAGNTSITSQKSDQSYTRLIEQYMDTAGSSGSSASSCICCIICIVCILSSGLGGISMPQSSSDGLDSSESPDSSSDSSSAQKIADSSSAQKSEGARGGFFSFF
jgi:hypothetical protein